MLTRRYAPVWILLLIGVLYSVADALPPPRPGLVDPLTQRFRTTGQKVPVFPEQVRRIRARPLGGQYPYQRRPAAVAGAAARPLAIDTRSVRAIRPMVLLIDFDDRQASPGVAAKSVFADLIFGAGPADLSVRNYWAEVSYDNLAVNGSAADINPGFAGTGWLRAGRDFATTITSYDNIVGIKTNNLRTLINDAVTSLAGRGAVLTPYVNPSDNTFYAVILVQPGYGAEDSGDIDNNTYSHRAAITPPIVTTAGDIGDYIVVPAIQYYSDPTPRDPVTGIDTNVADDPRIGIGVIVHEMGHLMNLPDMYPVTGLGQTDNTFSGVGVFDLMGYGLWGSNFLTRADVPAHLSAWSKFRLGWLTPRLVGSGMTNRTLSPVEIRAEADKILSNTDADPTQYFLVENRQVTSSLDTWLFDKYLTLGTGTGTGCLIWQIDEDVINAHPNAVNDNATFRGVSVKEADGVDQMGRLIPQSGTLNDLAQYYGDAQDFFPNVVNPNAFLDRTSPSARVNSAPIIDNTYTHHPFDFGSQVTMFGFARTAANEMEYVVNLSSAAAAGPAWKTFNRQSTQIYPLDNTVPVPPGPMRSDDILSLAFDSGNNVWMGSRGEGIFRFLGTRFDFLTTVRGLPSGSGTPVARIQAMAFEADTGSMWVGTEQGVYKMRDSGTGFRVVASFTTASTHPLPANNVQALAVRRGFRDGTRKIDIKYVGTAQGLTRIDDGNTDGEADDFVGGILTGNVTAIAIDDNDTPESAADDIVWVGTAGGVLWRSLLPTEAGGPRSGDPVQRSHFKEMVSPLTFAPRITSLAVDKKGRLWIGTFDRGVQAFDIGETLRPIMPNLRDPYDFNANGDTSREAYFDFNGVRDANDNTISNSVTGIAFQPNNLPEPVAWIAHQTLSAFPGGASRFDLNLVNDPATIGKDERLTVFSPIPPPASVTFGTSVLLTAAAADPAGNLWFATSDRGVFRFGNAGVVSLDSSEYVNVSALAVVTLQDDGLNLSATERDLAFVRIASTDDPGGFYLVLTETGPNTGVFRTTFGFTNDASDALASPPLLKVSNGSTVTAIYVDFAPPGVRSATATWMRVYPFDDQLVIEDFRCFVATAAYGSAMSLDVGALRRFRDAWLLSNPAGRALVAFYYRVSPPAAARIASRPALRAAARFALAPAALLAGFSVGAGPVEKAAVLLIVAACIALLFLLREKGAEAAAAGRPAAGADRSRTTRS